MFKSEEYTELTRDEMELVKNALATSLYIDDEYGFKRDGRVIDLMNRLNYTYANVDNKDLKFARFLRQFWEPVGIGFSFDVLRLIKGV